ncbi:hypothetical protein HCO57_13340 [Croceivirga sp. JEA036]|nr:hypothetical protein [Croceivirga sp. JEA036]
MSYNLLMIREKMKFNDYNNLKLKDTVVNLDVNKKTFLEEYNRRKGDTLVLPNFYITNMVYNYARASEIHFDATMFSIKDTVHADASYHISYTTGDYRLTYDVDSVKNSSVPQ